MILSLFSDRIHYRLDRQVTVGSISLLWTNVHEMTTIEVSLFNQGRFMIFSRGKRSATNFLTPSGKKLLLKKSEIFHFLKTNIRKKRMLSALG